MGLLSGSYPRCENVALLHILPVSQNTFPLCTTIASTFQPFSGPPVLSRVNTDGCTSNSRVSLNPALVVPSLRSPRAVETQSSGVLEFPLARSCRLRPMTVAAHSLLTG